MPARPALLITSALLLATALTRPVVEDAFANHADGNMPWSVNYWIVEDQLRVCNQGIRASVSQVDDAIAMWNVGAGRTIATQSCTNYGVQIVDVDEGTCQPQPALACAEYPVQEQPQLRVLRLEPDALNYGSDGLVSILAHELGHNLGFDHTSSCPNSLMAPQLCQPPVLSLRQVDIDNYHAGYIVDVVTPLSATSPSANTVNLTWSTMVGSEPIHNEKCYPIYRKDSGNWTYINQCAPKTTSGTQSSITLTGQPTGTQWYTIGGFTNADCYFGFCPYNQTGLSVNVLAPGVVDLQVIDYTPKPSSSTGTIYYNEGGSQQFTVTIRNNGAVAAPSSTVVMTFNGSPAPNPYGGVCNVGQIPPNGGTAQCTTVAVSMTFQGGPIAVIADYNNNVQETNEGNNTFSWGTLGVRPRNPTNVRVAPPYAAYAYTDQSAIETGFDVTLQRQASSACSSFVNVSGFPKTESALAGTGTDRIVLYSFAHGYCYRLRVKAKGRFADASGTVTSSTFWYP